mmetsp:Transcript_23777/g.24238  ORF Transcript_23777/g.24238 Transcript_23777/m.24238 type:complete len:93 (+) Transcript_23777:291-569(+)
MIVGRIIPKAALFIRQQPSLEIFYCLYYAFFHIFSQCKIYSSDGVSWWYFLKNRSKILPLKLGTFMEFVIEYDFFNTCFHLSLRLCFIRSQM